MVESQETMPIMQSCSRLLKSKKLTTNVLSGVRLVIINLKMDSKKRLSFFKIHKDQKNDKEPQGAWSIYRKRTVLTQEVMSATPNKKPAIMRRSSIDFNPRPILNDEVI